MRIVETDKEKITYGLLDTAKIYAKDIKDNEKMQQNFIDSLKEVFDVSVEDSMNEEQKNNLIKRNEFIDKIVGNIFTSINGGDDISNVNFSEIGFLLDELEEYTKNKKLEMEKKYGKEEINTMFSYSINKKKVFLFDNIIDSIKDFRKEYETELKDEKTEKKKSGLKIVKKDADKKKEEIPLNILLGILETRKYLEDITSIENYNSTLGSIKGGKGFYEKDKDLFDFFRFRGKMLYGWKLEFLTMTKLEESGLNGNVLKNVKAAPNLLVQQKQNIDKEYEYLKELDPYLDYSDMFDKDFTDNYEDYNNYPSIDLIGETSSGKEARIEVKHYSNFTFSPGKHFNLTMNRLERQVEYDRRYGSETFWNLNFYDNENGKVKEFLIPVKDLLEFYEKIKKDIDNQLNNAMQIENNIFDRKKNNFSVDLNGEELFVKTYCYKGTYGTDTNGVTSPRTNQLVPTFNFEKGLESISKIFEKFEIEPEKEILKQNISTENNQVSELKKKIEQNKEQKQEEIKEQKQEEVKDYKRKPLIIPGLSN